jgi:hypothetical protein
MALNDCTLVLVQVSIQNKGCSKPTQCCRMVESYFGLGHGKGVHDNVKAILQHELERRNSIWMEGNSMHY